MKNKKLFAILTLVCFMFTLMPVAAFAADPVGQVEVKASVDGSWGEKAVVEVKEAVEFQVKTAPSTATTTGYLYYVVDAATGDGVYIGKVVEAGSEYNKFTMKQAGEFEVYAVEIAGEKAAENTEALNGLVDKIGALTDAKTVKEVVATVQAWATANECLVKDYAKVVVEPKDANHVIALSGTAVKGEAPAQYVEVDVTNGFDAAVVTVNVQNNEVNVKDAEVEIIAPAFVTVTPVAGKVTDRHGNVSYQITASKAGDYTVVFNYKDARAVKLGVDATNGVVNNVVVATEAKAPIAIESSMATGIEFKFVDSDNVTVSSAVAPYNADAKTGVYKVSIVDQPANSTLKAAAFTLVDEKNSVTDGLYELNVAGLKQAGEYTVKVTLENGKSATATFTAAEFKTTVGIKFAPTAPKTVAAGKDVKFDVTKHIVYVDAKGVTKTYDGSTVVTLAANGNALEGVTVSGTEYTLKAKDNNDLNNYVGKTITVLAKDANNAFIATTEVTVVDAAMSIAYADTTAEVGVNKVLAGNVYDANGNKVATSGDVTATIISRPAGAYASVSRADQSKLGVTGGFTMNFIASVAGEYKVQTVIAYNNEYITSVETITVGDSTATFKDVIVMSIGANQLVKNAEVVAMPAAPEIVDSRTMVPARAGLEAFGAVVVWDEAARTVTAELNGVKVVMTIGEKAYTVNGKAMVGDAAPYITAASTMVPVSFFTNAFGIVATPIYDANGVCDVLFTK